MLEISIIQGVITFFSGFMEIYPELCIIITKQSSKIMIDFSQFDSLIAMTMYFNNEETCKNAIVETRWGVGEQQDVVCPYCGKHHVKMSKMQSSLRNFHNQQDFRLPSWLHHILFVLRKYYHH